MKENLITLFEKIAEKFPSKTAVEDEKGALTFSELCSQAKKKASELMELEQLKKEINPVPIGVVAHHTKETVVNILAVMYSGNFFVSFAEDTPQGRKQQILENSKLTLYLEENKIFYQESIEDFFELAMHHPEELFRPNSSCGKKTQFVETEKNPLYSAVEYMSYPGHECRDEETLYLVYTSGSTGVPKGVKKSWGSMKAFCEQYQGTFDLTEEVHLGNQTPFYFDAAMKDIFQMLTTGATLTIIPEKLFSFPVKLIEFLNEKEINMIVWVPSALKIVSVLNAFMAVKPQTIKKVFFVGEVFERKHLKNWMDNLPDAEFVNLYGSSEVAGVCAYYRVERKSGGKDGETQETQEKQNDPLPLGKGLVEDEVILVGEKKERIFPKIGKKETGFEEKKGTEDSEIGEICILGATLADGYYADEERTAAVFVENPFKEIPSKRMFRSGDMARYDASGNLVYCGRKDFQIKHMGYRIELEEIELAVRELPEIAAGACLYDEKKDKIVLFFQKTGEEALTKKEILSKLKGKLPDYMLPNKVVEVEEMPLNANGKTDRESLKGRL